MKLMTKTKRNLVLMLMCALLVAIAICPVSAIQGKSGVTKTANAVSSNDYSYMEISPDYTEIAANENLSLSADLVTGNFAIKNLKNGFVWYSTPNNTEFDGFSKGEIERFSKSQLIVGYVNAEDEVDTSRVAYLDFEELIETEVATIDNGIRVMYTFEVSFAKEEGEEAAEEEAETTLVKVPVDYYLEDDHFSAKVDIKSAEYTDAVLITEYNVLPYFGAGSWMDDGYLFVPDGSGALISFNEHQNDAYNYDELVYGDDLSVFSEEVIGLGTQSVRMPVFGIINGTDNALFGIVDKGASAASILASPANSGKGYSTASSKINTKLVSTTTMFSKSSNLQSIFRLTEDSDDVVDFKVDYYVLNGKDADYVGMANTYRDYLLEKELLVKNELSAPVLNVDVYGAIDVKANLLGFTYRKLQSLTTYDQAIQMADSLKKEGINNIGIRYKGWANNGITNKEIADDVKLIGLLGGKKGYKAFTEYTNKNGIQLYNDADLTTFTEGKTKFASKTSFSEVYYEYQYLRSVYAYDLNGYAKMLLNPKYLAENANKYISSFKKSGNKNLSISDLTDNVYSHLKRGESIYRTKYVTEAEKILENVKKNGLNLAGENSNAYAFKHLNKIYKAPIFSSGYNVFDSEVPFYEIVLHGYIPMTGEPMVQSTDSQVTFLKCVESGMELLWNGIHEQSEILSDSNYDDLYGSTYSLWIDDAAKKYSQYQPLLEKIYDKTIVDHKEVKKNVTLTEYDNGVKVYVNYTDADVTVDGIKVPAKNFAYKGV